MAGLTDNEWEEFQRWTLKELDTTAFGSNFMTASEMQNAFSGSKPVDEAPLDNETTEDALDDGFEAWKAMEKAELIAFAEKLGCNIYLAGYLRHLNEKLDIIADVFGSRKVMLQEPLKPKRRNIKT